MDFIIGGAFQGKLEYCMKKYGAGREDIFFAGGGRTDVNKKILCGFHMLVRDWLISGMEPEAETLKLIEKEKIEVFVSDEIGNGIVPADAFERKWREETGRCSSMIAQNAESVVRIFASMEQVIK